MTVSRSQPSTATPICCYCDHDLSCARCGHEQPYDDISILKARIEDLTKALQFIADGYDNQDVNHLDYRVKVYQVALDAIQPKREP